MLLPSAPHSAERFSAAASGLRSLLAAPDAARAAVVTRAVVASRRCAGGGGEGVAGASGDDGTSIGHSDDIEKAKKDEEEGMKEAAKEETTEEDEEDLDGFWVSYGRRRPRRRLPPPIPSLVARGALRRTRTGDGRLVIRIVPVVRPECVRARRRGDRLTMQLLEHQDDSPMMAPPLREPSSARRSCRDVVGAARAGDGTAAPAAGGVGGVEQAVAAPPAAPPPRVSSVGCFEEVFRLDPIGSSSLHQMMPSLRMVH
ncbi:uncharacterized protein LOC120657725 [Panicum virgatum]|uniref:FAF domain-containing protein n=1 Tax=Panicum virgatum TaxID=38727 RepID=A0A8T0XPR7_PANVG|nr:uncharacterized protein LOC120657725 [Panicum virgatum]KAG2661617.1 hypothetical protein PVAP13_1KG208586 [Panicum virgatum]